MDHLPAQSEMLEMWNYHENWWKNLIFKSNKPSNYHANNEIAKAFVYTPCCTKWKNSYAFSIINIVFNKDVITPDLTSWHQDLERIIYQTYENAHVWKYYMAAGRACELKYGNDNSTKKRRQLWCAGAFSSIKMGTRGHNRTMEMDTVVRYVRNLKGCPCSDFQSYTLLSTRLHRWFISF